MPSRVQLARTSAAVTGVPSEKRASSRNVTIQVRPSVVEPPGRSQAGTDTPHAVDADQRLVELTEQQSLARRSTGVARSPDRCDRVRPTVAIGSAGRGDQRAFIDGRTRQRVSDRRPALAQG